MKVNYLYNVTKHLNKGAPFIIVQKRCQIARLVRGKFSMKMWTVKSEYTSVKITLNAPKDNNV